MQASSHMHRPPFVWSLDYGFVITTSRVFFPTTMGYTTNWGWFRFTFTVASIYFLFCLWVRIEMSLAWVLTRLKRNLTTRCRRCLFGLPRHPAWKSCSTNTSCIWNRSGSASMSERYLPMYCTLSLYYRRTLSITCCHQGSKLNPAQHRYTCWEVTLNSCCIWKRWRQLYAMPMK